MKEQKVIKCIRDCINLCGEDFKLNNVKNLLKQALVSCEKIAKNKESKEVDNTYGKWMEEVKKGLTDKNYAMWNFYKQHPKIKPSSIGELNDPEGTD